MWILDIQKLKKSFPTAEGEERLIVDVEHFRLEAGSETALAGESGSGKTTFLHLISGVLKPDSGQIDLNGTSMETLSEAGRDRLRAGVLGYVFQNFNLLQGMTALENVELAMRFGGGIDPGRAKLLLNRMGLSNRLHHYPRQLSMGQQQRVAVARALANHPKLVLADEPTAHLDHVRGLEAVTLIREVCREFGATLLLVSHDQEILSHFQNVQHFEKLNRALHSSSKAVKA
ncbi:MAG TPA: ABC transporter ATP-binding protein [bacterium]|nr:ABC transporter ATP-binding protein [bacterium]